MICEIICIDGFLCISHLDIVHMLSVYVHVIHTLSGHMHIMHTLFAVVLDIFLPNRQCWCHPYVISSTLYISYHVQLSFCTLSAQMHIVHVICMLSTHVHIICLSSLPLLIYLIIQNLVSAHCLHTCILSMSSVYCLEMHMLCTCHLYCCYVYMYMSSTYYLDILHFPAYIFCTCPKFCGFGPLFCTGLPDSASVWLGKCRLVRNSAVKKGQKRPVVPILHILLQWWNVTNWTYFIWPICDQWERYVFDLIDYNAKARWISLRLRYFPVGLDENPMKSRTFLPSSIGNGKKNHVNLESTLSIYLIQNRLYCCLEKQVREVSDRLEDLDKWTPWEEIGSTF